jgi:hypothetical protein
MTTPTVFDEAIEAAQTFFENPNITRKMVTKQSKERKFVRLRWFVAAFMRARDPQRFSYPVIMRLLKKKDHTTILHAVRQAHKEWGERFFVKIAAIRPLEQAKTDTIEQPVHRVSAEDIDAIGAANLAKFVNGHGWEAAA